MLKIEKDGEDMTGWKEYRLNDLGEILDSRRIPLSSLERAKRQGQYPYYGASGIIDYIDDYLFEGEHVLISEDGENLLSRNTPIAFIVSGRFWVNNHAHIFKGNAPYINRIVMHYLQSSDLNEFITGAAQPKLSQRSLLSIPFYLPAEPVEQKAIAAILSSLDDKIDLLHRQNATLEAMAEALFRQWFVVEAKEEWEDITVADLAIINQQSKNKNYPYQEIKYLDTGSLTNGIFEGFQNYHLDGAPSRAQRLVKHNDILISLVRPNQKHYGIIKKPSQNLVVSTGFCVLTCKNMNPHFLYLFLTSNEMTEFLHSVAEGSTSAYPALVPSDIANLELKRPPAEKLSEFSSYADSAWEKITHNQTQIRTLKKLRDTLLPKLMSGEVRVEC